MTTVYGLAQFTRKPFWTTKGSFKVKVLIALASTFIGYKQMKVDLLDETWIYSYIGDKKSSVIMETFTFHPAENISMLIVHLISCTIWHMCNNIEGQNSNSFNIDAKQTNILKG